jgi:hypothetical protein
MRQEPYGDYTKIGETIGVLLEFTSTGGQVTYYRNGVSLGKAFDNLPQGTMLYPCVSLYNNEETECQVTLNT